MEQISAKTAIQALKPYLYYLINPGFQGLSRLILSFENDIDSRVNTQYYFLTVQIKDHNVMIEGQNFFDRLVKNGLGTYENIQKIAIGQGDDCITGCLLDYNCFSKYYKMIAINLSKQEVLDVDLKTMQQINFIRNLARDSNVNTTIIFIIEEATEIILDFSEGTVIL